MALPPVMVHDFVVAEYVGWRGEMRRSAIRTDATWIRSASGADDQGSANVILRHDNSHKTRPSGIKSGFRTCTFTLTLQSTKYDQLS